MPIEFKSFKYRIYPNSSQKNQIDFYLMASRNAYNYYLEISLDYLKSRGQACTYYEMLADLQSFIKKHDKYVVLDRSVFIYALKDVEKNIHKYVKNNDCRPKIKTEGNNYYACKIKCNYENINMKGKINISEIKGIKYRGTIELSGRILNATISKTPTDKYYVSFLCKHPICKNIPKTSKSVGIDAGFMNLATLSDKTIYENSNEYLKMIGRISYKKKKLSNMQRGSNRYKKQRIKISKLYETMANRRNDNLQKITTEIVKKYDEIHVETLMTNKMINSSKNPERIYDAAWYEMQRLLEYKCLWYEKNYKKVPVYYPSSQICSKCGYINKNLKDVRIKNWICPKCNTKHDRDINAAQNILNYE